MEGELERSCGTCKSLFKNSDSFKIRICYFVSHYIKLG